MIVVKTGAGQQVMKDRSVPLTPRQRSALILVDGRRTREQLLVATAAAGATREDVDKLFELGLIGEADGTPAVPETQAVPAAAASTQPTASEPAGQGGRTPQERYSAAYPIATRLTAGLGLRGFRLNLAVEGAGGYEELLELAPKIREAVGPQAFDPLEQALNGP